MPKSLFLLPALGGIDQIPVILNDGVNGGICYLDAKGEVVGGIWIAENTEVPLEHTIAVIIHSSNEMLDEMAANLNYLFLKDLPDG